MFSDQEIVFLFHVIHDRFVHAVSRHLDRLAIDDAPERDDRDIGRASADIHDHVAGRLRDRQPRSDGCRNGLFDEIDLARPCQISRIFHGALFYLRNPRRHPDNDARSHERAPVVGFRDEIPQHLFGHLEVRDDSLFHRPDRHNMARSAA